MKLSYTLQVLFLAFLVTFSGMIIFPGRLRAQLISTCPNSNFNLGNWTNWVGTYGTFQNPAQYSGLDTNVNPPYPHGNFQCYQGSNPAHCPPLHSIIPGPGTLDPNTGDSLISVFPGEAFSAKLGHDVGGSHAATLKYTVYVNSSTYLFIYRYGVVLQNNNHSFNQQPSFTVAVLDSVGNLIDPTCGYYYIYANDTNLGPGWHRHGPPPPALHIDWKEWTTVGMSLTSYVGHHVSIIFTIRDCQPGGHFGYAYVSAYCSYLTIQTSMCQGDSTATLTAPPGFAHYYWSNGDTIQSIVVPHPTTGETYTCTLTAVNGCQNTISMTLTYTVIHANFTHGSACAGLPTQFYDSSYVNQNAVTGWKWNFGDGTPVVNGVQNPQHTFALPGTYNVKLVSHSTEGCKDSITKAVIVDTLPALTNNPLSKKICSRANTNIVLTSNMAGATFTWTATSNSALLTGWSSNTLIPTTVINQTLTNTDNKIDTVTYHITPHSTQCTGLVVNYKVAVKPLPILTNSVLTKSICDSTPTNIVLTSNNDSTLFTWTCTASSLNLSGYSNNTTIPGLLINQVIYNSGFSIETVTYHIVPHSFGCLGDTSNYTVTVYPFPDLSNIPLTKSLCNNSPTNITLTSHVPGTLFTWTCNASSGNVSGYSNNATPTILLNQTLFNSGFNVETVTYHIVPHANGCAGHTFNFVVTVYPVPNLSNNPASMQICSNGTVNIALTSNVVGTLFTWTATGSSGNVSGFSDNATPTTMLNQTLINTGFNIEFVTYLITPLANGCTGNVYSYVVTVYPTPDVYFSPPGLTICSGQTINIQVLSHVTGATFTWTATASSINLSGFSGGSGTLISQTLVNSGNTIEAVTYHATPVANSCTGTPSDVIVNVNPTPVVTNNPMNQTICSGFTTSITLTSSVANSTFSWTVTSSSPNLSGYAAGNGTTINQTITNSGFTIEFVTYHISAKANGCTGPNSNFVVTVNPTPDVSNNPLTSQICSQQTTNILITSHVAGTTFTWTASGSSANVSGYFAGSGSAILQTLTNSGFNIETVTYHITPHANGCDGPVSDWVVTVNPVPDLSNTPLAKQICTNTNTNIALTSDVTGTLFTWTCTPSSGNVTGFSNNAIPTTLLNQILINTGFNIEAVTYHITPHANNCPGILYDFVVTVYPLPNLSNAPLSKQICNNTNTNITLTSNVNGTMFTWTATPSSGNVSGFSNNAIPTVVLNDLLINSGFSIETVTYHILPNANGCDGNITNFVVTVYPTPDLSNIPLNKQICNNTLTGIVLTSDVSGTLFTWTATPSSGNILGFSNNGFPTTVLNQLLTNTSFTNQSVIYHITPHANGCDGVVYDFQVTVYPQADLSNTPLNKQLCSGSSTNLNLTSNVTGTLFTWTCTASSGNVSGWINNNIPTAFLNQTLSNSGFSIEFVTYHITASANGCAGNTTDYVVTVYPVPDLSNTPLNESICKNQNTNLILTSHVAGTLFTWTCTGSSGFVTGYSDNAIPTILLNQVLYNTNNIDEFVTYHITPHANGCDGPLTDYVVTVRPRPILTVNPMFKTICSGDPVNIVLQATCVGTTFSWVPQLISGNVTGYASGSGPVINDILTNNINTAGVVTYTVSFQASGCTGNDTVYTVNVNPTPHVTNNPMTTSMCSGSTTNISLISDVAGASFSYIATGSSPNVTGFAGGINPLIAQTLTNTGFNIETVTYRITPTANGCSGPFSNYVVTIFPVPDLSNNPPSEQICNNQSTNLTLTSHVAGTLFTWTCTPSSGNVSGFSNNNIPTTFLNQTLVNSGFSIESVTYHMTPHANGCDGPVTDFVVTLVSKPDLTNNPPAKQICNNTSTNIILTSNVNGTLFTWTATGSSGNVSGYSNNAIPTIILNQTLSNSSFINQTVTYHVVPHANGCDGDTTSFVVTVYPTPDLTNNPLTKSQCNNTATNIILTSNVAGTQFTWTCTPGSGNIGGFSNNVIPTVFLNQTLVNTGFAIETVTYHITPQANNCNGAIYHYVVTVYPTADVFFIPPSQTLCSQQTTNLQILSHVAGTTFSWTATSSSINLSGFAGGIGNLISQTITNSGNTIETITYHVTPVANSCTGTSADVIVTVNPTPLVTTTPLNQSICSGNTTSITLTSGVAGTTFAWTLTSGSPNLSGFSFGNGFTINQTITNSGFTIEAVTYHITPSANGCSGPIADYVVTVFPVPDLSNNPPTEQICNNQSTNLTLTSHVAGTLFTWTCTPSSGNVSGFSNNNIPTTFLNQTLVNSGFSIEAVTYHMTPHANGCDGPVTDFVVTLVSKPDLTNNPPAKQICNNTSTNIILTSNVNGTLFTWTTTGSSGNVSGYSNNSIPTIILNQTLSNSSFINQTVTYHIVPHANGCDGDTTSFVVTVYPTPDLTNNPLAKSQCNNTSTNIGLGSDVAGTQFTWTCTPGSGNISGFSNNAIPTVLLNQTLVNSGFAIETVTYHITPQANNCSGSVYNYVVTVFPTADVYFIPSNQTICSQQTTNIQILSHVAGTTFSWTATPSSVNLSGFSGGNVNVISQTITNSGNTIETITYHATPTANSCTGTSADVVVTVNPTPLVTTAPLNQTICAGFTTAINLTSSVAGSTFAWTVTSSSPNLSGFSPGSGFTINQTIANSGFTIENVSYYITPTANSCPGPVSTYVVTVNPTPDVSNNPLTAQICSSTSPNIGLLSHVTGATFSWSASGSSPNITGYSPGNGLVINQVLINTGFNTETVTYHITPTANGCVGPSKDFVVTVFPVPDVYFNPVSQTLCSNQTTNIQNLSHVAGTTFTWTASPSSGNLSGFSGGSGNLIAQTLFNSGSTIETVIYTVTPQANGCPPGLSHTVIVTVDPRPAVTNNITSFQICSATNITIPLQSNVAGTTFAWTASGSSPNVTGFSAGNGTVILQNLINSGFNIETVIYTVTPTANGCAGTQAVFTVTVFPVADVYFTPAGQAFCSGGTTNLNLASHVAGASFTWTATGSSPNVTGFSPGSGTLIQQTLINSGYMSETVNYAANPTANGCPGVISHGIVTVNPWPVVSLTTCWDPVITADAQPVKLKGGIPLGGTYSGAGVNTGIFYPGIAGAGIFTINYSYTNGFGCSNNSSQTITVISPVAFTCGNVLTDVRDNNQYSTVQFGNQCWMAANLNFGNIILSSQMQRDNCISEKYCFDDIPVNCSSTGGLYQWDELMKFDNNNGAQGFCPPGWHIPKETDWNALFDFYVSNGFAGSALKFTGFSGFDAFLSGVRHENVTWRYNNFAIMFWSSTAHGSTKAWAHGMNSLDPSVSYYPSLRANAFPVRCIKD